MTGDDTAENLLRGYFKEKKAAKIESQRLAAEAEEKAAATLKARCGSFATAINIVNAYHVRRDYIEPTTKALRAALKKAEAKEAKAKESEAWKKICVKACAPLSKKAPKAPLKGVGYAREDFPTVGNNAKMQAIFAAIPSSHKDKISSRRQKGYFSWSPVISPEAMKKVSHLITLATK